MIIVYFPADCKCRTATDFTGASRETAIDNGRGNNYNFPMNPLPAPLANFSGIFPDASPEHSLLQQIDSAKLPAHVAIIMDGNGRWAQMRHIPRAKGHEHGSDAAREVTESAARLGIAYLTLFTFSTENSKRPASEVNFLMRMLYDNLVNKSALLHENGIRLKVIGDISPLPRKLREKLAEVESLSRHHRCMQLNLALNYGSRDEILRAVRRLIAAGVSPSRISHKVFSAYLDTASVPDPDLLIRTSGEFRLSNFLLYQSAYTELYFTPTLWPDFKARELFSAVVDYQSRQRRFGKL